MYFRHLYAVQQPSLDARCDSWANYQALFGVILHSNVNMQLPNGWLWDIIDEFVCVFRVTLSDTFARVCYLATAAVVGCPCVSQCCRLPDGFRGCIVTLLHTCHT